MSFFSSVSSPNDRPRQYLLIFLTKGQIDMSVNIFVQLFVSCGVVVFITFERLLDIGIIHAVFRARRSAAFVTETASTS